MEKARLRSSRGGRKKSETEEASYNPALEKTKGKKHHEGFMSGHAHDRNLDRAMGAPIATGAFLSMSQNLHGNPLR